MSNVVEVMIPLAIAMGVMCLLVWFFTRKRES